MAALFQCSSLTSVKDFKRKVASTIDEEDTGLERSVMDSSKLASEMDITQETLTELKDVCSPTNLKFEDGLVDDMDVKSKSAYFAQTDLASLKVVFEKGSESGNSKTKMFKSKPRNYMILSEELRNTETDHGNKIDGPEVILSAAVYHPVTSTKVQEFLVLGRQTLVELRDKIFCPADSIVVGEHSENPDFTTVTTAKDICPSGFIFIEGVFYNDTRSDICRDYSKLIMDWTNGKHRGELPRFGFCTSKKMEETKFEDLTIKLGYPYVYLHQGNCEHLLIFRDLRMLHTDDPKCVSSYPFKIFRPRPKRHICMICSIYSARWLTRGDLLMSEDPSLFCEKCFKSLHYNKNQKAYAFKAYQYSGDYYW